ncbi:hypothetical protein BB561_002153 [Smittium simulii]|uniref:Uncharacterized protein n=1 Tax=Smittium simulii TaxID=133385 RepID=A0A2T9YRK6_9FUNG|nr:hypothetical protein BB561_002153 [Smittium simulii]
MLSLTKYTKQAQGSCKYLSCKYYATKSSRLNVLFFGSDDFSISTLTKLLEYQKTSNSNIENLCVVTPPLKKIGRGLKQLYKAPLLDFAEKHNIGAYLAPEKTMTGWKLPKYHKSDQKIHFDLAIVSSFGYFIPKHIIEQFSTGAINIHPSLLPMYRGASPIQYAILNQDKYSGVSLQKLDPQKIDTGEILLQKCQLKEHVFRNDLEKYLGDLGGDLTVSLLENFSQLYAIKQDEHKVSYAPKIKKSMSVINWEIENADSIYAKYRAFGDKILLRTTFKLNSKPKIVMLDEIGFPSESPKKYVSEVPGTILFDEIEPKKLYISCANNSVISAAKMSYNHENNYYSLNEILAWETQQVEAWLRQVGFSKYTENFCENMICGEALLELNYTYLKDLNISSVGDRVKLSNAISKLRESSIKRAQENSKRNDFTDNISAKMDDLKLWKFAWEKDNLASKDSLLSEFNINTSSPAKNYHIAHKKPAPSKSFSSFRNDLKIYTTSRTTSKFPFVKNVDLFNPFDNKTYLSSPEICLESPSAIDTCPVTSLTADKIYASLDKSPNSPKIDHILAEKLKTKFPNSQTPLIDKKQFNSSPTYLHKTKMITVEGPNNESNQIYIYNCKSGKEILDCTLQSFDLHNDTDVDIYSIFMVSSEGEGARIVENAELFNLCSDNQNVENARLFLKKRHLISATLPSAERDAELQRTIEKLGNFVPVAQSTPKFNKHQHNGGFFNSKKTHKNRLNLHVLPHKKSFNQLYKATPTSNKTPNVVLSQHLSPIVNSYSKNLKKLSSFFGNRPPSNEVHKNLDVFFPGNEVSARNSIIRGHMKKVLNYSVEHVPNYNSNNEPLSPPKIPLLRTQHSADNFDSFAKNEGSYKKTFRAVKKFEQDNLTNIKNSPIQKSLYLPNSPNENNYISTLTDRNHYLSNISSKNNHILSSADQIHHRSDSLDQNHYLSSLAVKSLSTPLNLQVMPKGTIKKFQQSTPSSENGDMPNTAMNTSDPRNSSSNNYDDNKHVDTETIEFKDINPNTQQFDAEIATIEKVNESMRDYNRLSSLNEIKKELMLSAHMSWIKGAPICSGSFGSVFYGIHTKTGIIMAVKQVDIPTPDSESKSRKHKMFNALKLEIELLKTLQHKNIVRYLGYESDSKSLYIFLEYVPGGSVKTALLSFGVFPESLVKFYIRQILEGLVYLHDSNIIHCDIKGGNVLIDHAGNVKISDFGISKKVEEVGLNSKNRAMAPEIVQSSNYSPKCDIWSLGCLVIEMLTGKHPFPESDQFQALLRIGKNNKPEIPSNISPEASDFIEKTLAIDLNKRPSAKELLDHSFVLSGPKI